MTYSQIPNEDESKASPAREHRSTRPAGAPQPARPSTQKARSKKGRADSTQSEETELALFSLIADPHTIAGIPAVNERAKTADSEKEVERLRQALHAREQELEDLRRRAEPTESDKPDEYLSEEMNPTGQDLLDSKQAHRLAKEARQSEQASRLALEAAQKAARTESIEPQAPLAERPLNEQSWETRPLSVQKHWLETTTARAERPEHNDLGRTRETEARATLQRIAPRAQERANSTEIQLRAARAEARELEATLSLARDTALTQKLEIARLRSELEEAPERAAAEMAALEDAFRAELPEEESLDAEAIRIEAQNSLRIEMAQATVAAEQEIERLRERVSLGEREMEAREAERRVLRETLVAREEELQTVRSELAQMALSLEEEREERRALTASLEAEREQNADSQSLLARLRNTLHTGPGESEMPIDRQDQARPAQSQRAVVQVNMHAGVDAAVQPDVDVDDLEPTGTSAAVDFLAERPERSAVTEETKRSATPVQLGATETGRLFDAWQDDQVRRYFGPFGIDTTRDLVMAPLSRRNPTLEHPAKILVLGSGAERWAELLAEDLIASESPPFHILLGGDGAYPRRTNLGERPIDEFISATRTPHSAAEFEALLAETRPSIIVSRNFLSGIQEVGPWLDVLREMPRTGPSLVLLESTGIGPVAPADAMLELGDRIWSLMPARYTRTGHDSDARLESWQAAFEQMPPVPSNGLRAALREGFELEISAQFGFLSEPFLRSPIAENFDPDAQRDRRFLHQIADVDDRKIEAGIAPALHFVARIDGRVEDGD